MVMSFAFAPNPGLAETVDEALVAIINSQESNSKSLPANIDDIRQFYKQRDGKPAWIAEGWSEQAEVLRSVLSRAAEEGLDPDSYRVEIGNLSPRSLAEAELALTASALRYIKDVRSGRRTPKEMDPNLYVYPRDADAAERLLDGLASPDFEKRLQELSLSSPRYQGLKKALLNYRELAKIGPWPTLSSPSPLKKGTEDPAVATLVDQLTRLGILSREKPHTPNLFDGELEEAVRVFQDLYGLDVDGVVGAQTRLALNTSPAERIVQITINMERRRWLPEAFEGTHVVVNLPAFALTVVQEGRELLSMPVVVGTDRRRTPVFADKIVNIVLNPTWTVPRKIAREDILPKLVSDPDYLSRNGFRVFDGWESNAIELNPADIDWSKVQKSYFPFKLRQEPGKANALGLFRFSLTNTMDIYLHDTPKKELFGKSARAFSSGCIRLGDPLALSVFTLSGNSDWPKQRILDTVAGSTTTVAKPSNPLPVYVLYETSWTDQEDRVHFRPDIYNRDKILAKALGLSVAAGK